MSVDIEKMGYVKMFIEQLHRGECNIDPKANDIPYDDNKSLADALSHALQELSEAESVTLSQYPYLIVSAYNMITAVRVRGLVIEKDDIRKKLRDTEGLLERCEEQKAKLQDDLNKLHKINRNGCGKQRTYETS